MYASHQLPGYEMNRILLATLFSSAAALFIAIPAHAQSDAAALPADQFTTTTQQVQDHALVGEFTLFQRPDGRVVGASFRSTKSGQVIMIPRESITAMNAAVDASRGLNPTAGPIVTITWEYNMPGGGSVYSASVGGALIGFFIVQPNGTVNFVAL